MTDALAADLPVSSGATAVLTAGPDVATDFRAVLRVATPAVIEYEADRSVLGDDVIVTFAVSQALAGHPYRLELEHADGSRELVAFGTIVSGQGRIAVTLTSSAGGEWSTYTHVQRSPASTWTVEHGLGRHANVVVTDTADQVVVADVTYVSDDVVQISFSDPIAGRAYIGG